MKKIILFLFLALSATAFAQQAKTMEIKINTTIECDMCKKRVESGLAYEKGVKFSKVDVPTKTLTVTYNAAKTSPEKIKLAVSKMGYNADEIKADTAAYNQLPECCKAGGHEHTD